MPWPHCSASPTSSQWFQHVQWRSHLSTVASTQRCYITMITPKHTVSWHQLVPYIDTHNISRWIHDPTDTMGWFPSPFSTTWHLTRLPMQYSTITMSIISSFSLTKGKIYRLACNRTYAHRISDIFYPHAEIECQMPCWRVVNMRGEDRLHT